MCRKFIIFCAFALLLISTFPPRTVHADMAPPLPPPGSNLVPGAEITQVRMVAETVTLTILKDPSNAREAIAKTEALFTMRNLGTVEETMQARFPLSFANGRSDGYGKFPEIPSIVVKVDGQTIPTKREDQPFYDSGSTYPPERDVIPWAVFNVSFPPGKDVMIDVSYTVNGSSIASYESFEYVLETGAGWNGTIGSADVIIRLPYEVNKKNVWVENVSGYTPPSDGGVMSANEVRWHFDDLEPTREDNIDVIVVTPSVWESVLKETDIVQRYPNDGEAWGRLAKAYKEIVSVPGEFLREDAAGLEMFELSRNAYERCLTLLPQDSLWQYGYADLLWFHYYSNIYLANAEDMQGILTTILQKLQTALVLDPNNQRAKDLLIEISYAIPDAVRMEGDNFVFLGLTATPFAPTPWAVVETPTFVPTVIVPSPTFPMGVNTPEPVSAPSPLCGSAFLLPALLGVFWISKRRAGS